MKNNFRTKIIVSVFSLVLVSGSVGLFLSAQVLAIDIKPITNAEHSLSISRTNDSLQSEIGIIAQYVQNKQDVEAIHAIDNIINNQALPLFQKEQLLYQLVNRLASVSDTPIVRSALERLSEFQATIRLPHHDVSSRSGALQFNIAGQAKATLTMWRQNDAKALFTQLLVSHPKKIIDLFLSDDEHLTPEKKGALEAIFTVATHELVTLKSLLSAEYKRNANRRLHPVLLNTSLALADTDLAKLLLANNDYYAQQFITQLIAHFPQESVFSLLKQASSNPALRSLAYSQMSKVTDTAQVTAYLEQQLINQEARDAAAYALARIENNTEHTQRSSQRSTLRNEEGLYPQIWTLTENDPSDGNLAIGVNVLIPQESLTPLDGFRSYQSLKAYHQSIAENNDYVSAHNVGTSIHGETIWSYALSDNNTTTAEGMIPEPAVMIDGGIHAREWQTPEVVSSTLEYLAANAKDKGVNQYLLENLNILITPVINVDSFIHTQKYADKFMVFEVETGDPDYPTRLRIADGRFRRKNRHDVDDSLSSFSDNRFGVDINRNFGSDWGIDSEESSPLKDHIKYRGESAYSEPETQAVLAAAELGPANRLRYYTNTHSFSSFYSVPYTSNDRRNRLTENLAQLMIESTYAQEDSPRRYDYFDDVGYSKAGFAAEHFAEVYQIPSYILEVEPYDADLFFYNGFMLAETKIRALAQKITNTTLLAFYHQAGPAIVESVEIYNTETKENIFTGSWQASSANDRSWQFNQLTPITADTNYQLKLSFNKPMRYRNTNGEIVNHPGVDIPLLPEIIVRSANGSLIALSTNSGKWLNNQATNAALGYKRYQDDSFLVEFSLPSSFGSDQEQQINLELNVQDLAGMQLDANPQTVVDWLDGGWSGYENTDGQASDTGGIDKTISIQLAATKAKPQPEIEPKDKPSGGSTSRLVLIALLCFCCIRFIKMKRY
ncbi:M14 family zinc carboxypeptidase [Thalassotalea fusca]